MQTTGIYIPNDELEAVTAGKKRMFFWGWATYHDIFPRTPARLSEFCFIVSGATWTKPDNSDSTADITIGTPSCPTHNCYDEECKDYQTRTR